MGRVPEGNMYPETSTARPPVSPNPEDARSATWMNDPTRHMVEATAELNPPEKPAGHTGPRFVSTLNGGVIDTYKASPENLHAFMQNANQRQTEAGGTPARPIADSGNRGSA